MDEMEQEMSIVFTGLAQNVCATVIEALGPKSKVRFLSPDDVLHSAPSKVKASQVVWFYRAPWLLSASLDTSSEEPLNAEESLSRWLKYHRAVLRKRRSMNSQLLLVNADQVNFHALLEQLKLPGATPVSFCRTARDLDRALSALLEKCFESSFIEHWDVFAALEALAWHSAPSLLGGVEEDALSESAVLKVCQFLLDAQDLPDIKAALAQAQAQVSQYANNLASLRNENQSLIKRLDSTQQAQQVEGENPHELAALEKQCHEIEAKLNDAQTALSEQTGKATAAEIALSQLQAEKFRADTALEQLRSKLEALQEQNAELNAVAEKARQEARAFRRQFAQELESSNQAMSKAIEQRQAQLDVALGENELLLLQMRQIQEDLESYFLENRQLEEAVVQSRDSQERARKLISHLMSANAPSPAAGPVVAAASLSWTSENAD